MAYQVIARKWRSQSFHDLVGQEHISTTLLNALRNDRLPQALLFTGVRGTGKTSSARILAKSLRCPNAKDFVPCGECPQCEDIANSRSLDVIEIDGASNNGVDAIRELRETVGYMPSSGRYKVYIIDEVHMLSTSAFNALLKTLEEPPPHVVFVMATTEAQKIPNTILSRCQRFDFRRIPSRLIAGHLEKICKSEKVKTQPEALWLVARLGDGSMRDAQSLLDQVITFADGEVTLAKTIEVLGLTDRTLLLNTLEALVTRDTRKTVAVIEQVFKAGYDSKVFAQDLLEEIRNALLVRLCADDPARVVDLPDTEIQNLQQLTKPLTEEDLHLLFDMCLKGVNDLLRAQDARIVLEMLLLRMAAAPRVASLTALATGTIALPVYESAGQALSAPANSQEKKFSASSFMRPAGTPPGTKMPASAVQPTGTATAIGHQQQPTADGSRPTANGAAPVDNRPAPSQEHDDAPSAMDPARANDPWYKFVDRVKKANSLLGAMLENTHMIGSEGSKLTIGVPKKMSFMFDKVKDPENVKRIETFIETFWNKTVSVDVKLEDEKAGKVSSAIPRAMAEEAQASQKRTIEKQVEENPLVQQAQNVFKTQIKTIKESR
ncbi:MAG: DNA polymerase III subunit gamma/tau [Bdellovibrionota bacterium]